MKRFLLALLVLISLGLCAVSVAQWQREHRLRATLADLARQLAEENRKRVEFEEKALRFEIEIARLTDLRAQTEAALLDATEQVQTLISDQAARGYSIAVLSNEHLRAAAELAALRDLAGQGAEAVRDRNSLVSEQNSVIEKANTELRRLAGERDDAIRRLNERTREFNELVEKYNELAKRPR
jgi:septal ring factor EnvC (AmiA/AmiB activator)